MTRFILIVFSVVATSVVAGNAHATTDWQKHWAWRWAFPDARGDFHPYMTGPYSGVEPVDPSWQPQDWTRGPRDAARRVDHFMRTGIIEDTGEDYGVPSITVGPNFYRLGQHDQEKVVRLVDSVQRLTAWPGKTLYLIDWHSDKVVGVYANNVLQRY